MTGVKNHNDFRIPFTWKLMILRRSYELLSIILQKQSRKCYKLANALKHKKFHYKLENSETTAFGK